MSEEELLYYIRDVEDSAELECIAKVGTGAAARCARWEWVLSQES